MKQICVFLVLLLLISCEYFNAKKTSSEAILKEELQTFNWKDVDEYPAFSSCDSSASRQERRKCFVASLTTHISNYLQKETIIVTQDINDTIVLNLQVNDSGVLTLLNAKVDSLTTEEIPSIKSLLSRSLDSLPKIFPAIKRGQQVTTEFKLPIIINMN